MTTIFAPIPKFVFTVFEPLSLVGGFLFPLLSPSLFVSSQIPSIPPSLPSSTLPPTTHVVTLQLGNAYLLLCLIGVAVLYTPGVPKTLVRNYLIALAVGDVGHLAVTGWSMGVKGVMNVGGWSSVAWGNIGITVGLLMVRLAWLGNWFQEREDVARRQEQKSR